MKKIILISYTFLFTTLAYAQVNVTVPIGALDYTNGAYFKDIDNELSPYIGTWEGVLNNRKYTFVFQLFVQHLTSYAPLSDQYYYRDTVMGKFKVTDLPTGTVLYDSLSAKNHDDYPIYGAVPHHNLLTFTFNDTLSNCQNSLGFSLKTIQGNPNQFKYCCFDYSDWWRQDICGYANRLDIPVYLPIGELVLTKL